MFKFSKLRMQLTFNAWHLGAHGKLYKKLRTHDL